MKSILLKTGLVVITILALSVASLTDVYGGPGDPDPNSPDPTQGSDDDTADALPTPIIYLPIMTLQPIQNSWMSTLQFQAVARPINIAPLEDAFKELTVSVVSHMANKSVVLYSPPPLQYKWEVEQLPYLKIAIKDLDGDKNIDEVVLLSPGFVRTIIGSDRLSDLSQGDAFIYQTKFNDALVFAKNNLRKVEDVLKQFNTVQGDKVFQDDQGHWRVKILDEAGKEKVLGLRYQDAETKEGRKYRLFTPRTDKATAADPAQSRYSVVWQLTSPRLVEFPDLRAMVHKLLTTGHP